MASRGVNSVTLIGHLGNDPETKYTAGGMAVCTLSLATTSVRKDKDGQQVERTEWHRIKLFGKLGEIAGEYLKKGRQVYIEGSIRYDKFTGQDGVEKYFTDIIADEMQMLGGNADGERAASGESRSSTRSQSGGTPARQSPRNTSGQQAPSLADSFADDDIPFLVDARRTC